MKRRGLMVGLAACALLYGAYSYYYSDLLTTIDLTKWTQNGSPTPTANGLTAPNGGFGALFSTVAVPDGTSDYEVKMTIRLQGAAGGEYWTNLRAAWNGSSWNSYVVQYKPTYISGSTCNGSLLVGKNAPGWSQLALASVNCHDGMVVRTVMRGSTFHVFVDNSYVFPVTDTQLATGKPGVGVENTPSGTSVSRIDLGPLDRIAPAAVSSASIVTTALPNRVDAQWTAASDDANGSGVWKYKVFRNGVYWTDVVAPAASFTDLAVSPGVLYTYNLITVDGHLNESAGTSFTVLTPGGAPGRIGVRPSTGSYWGAGGEKIDMLSGNLNYTLPLVKAQGRGGWGVGFALSYNSQLWWKDGATTWKRGKDVGYGFGWKLLAGALTPVYSDPNTISSYVFTDSTGAEYRLITNTAGVWTSREAIYVSYDSAANKLLFPDGSFWVLGCTSGSSEADAGTNQRVDRFHRRRAGAVLQRQRLSHLPVHLQHGPDPAPD